MMNTSNPVDVDGFDREYGIEDLFPAALAGELLAEIDGRCKAWILLPDGTVHHGANATAPCVPVRPKQGVATGDRPQAWTEDGVRRIRFDLVHELESIGCLVLEGDADAIAGTEIAALGRFASGLIHRIIQLNYSYCITAGLHGRVVTDSHERLKQKAEALAASEEKYRRLAQSLEIEVEKKTRAIEAAQLRMLQQEKMAAIGQLAAGMAHEINNPVGFVISNLNTLTATLAELTELIDGYRELSAILANASTIQRATGPLGKQMAHIEHLVQEMDLGFVLADTTDLIEESLDGAKRVKIIVQNLREFAHPSKEAAESVDVNACLDTTLAMLSSHAGPGTEIVRRYGDIPRLVCRLREMNQVYYSILKNAFQAIGGKGTIRIRTAVEDDTLRVEIADTGPGIAHEHMPRLFDPFFTTREVGGGIGLGLFQAYTTVKGHNGSIAVDSSPGEGSTFTVILPQAHDERPALQPASAPTTSTGKRRP